MAYSINPNLPKARVVAMQLLIVEGLPLVAVANKCGVHRSTIWRWKRKWEALNQEVQIDNPEPLFCGGQNDEQHSGYLYRKQHKFKQEAQEYFAPYRKLVEDIINALERGMEPIDKTEADVDIAKAKEQIS